MAATRFGSQFEILTGYIADPGSVERALAGSFGLHVNLSGEIEKIGTGNVSSTAWLATTIATRVAGSK